jgi:hypothetical protein
VAQRDVPARDLNGVIKHHIAAIIVSGVATEIRTGRPTPNIRQKFLVEATCAVLAVYMHILKKLFYSVEQVEKVEMVMTCCTHRRRRETQTGLWWGNLKEKGFL